MNTSDTPLMISVSAQDAGQRWDKFLATSLELSRARIGQLAEGEYIRVNQKPITKLSTKTQEGDICHVTIPDLEDCIPQPEEIPLDILFEDDDVIVINKPVGMVVHPAPGNPTGTLVNALLHHCGDSLSGINGIKRPGIVHRIDKDTSGLLVVAKNDAAHQGLATQFENKTLNRTYVAVVWGLTPEDGIITGNIGRHPKLRQRMAVLQTAGKPAETHFERVQGYRRAASLVECQLKTGRTHQIRVHMNHIQHSLVGDGIYGKTPRNIPLALQEFLKTWPAGRQALHAKALTFMHPISHKTMSFESPLPRDMLELINVLESL